ncbi:MAG: DUF3105 domain-containing protein [Microthrixaceae bacterium]|nr:DUF3105 domain-containing protein [Microthrixaceae bacterium]
MTPTQSQPGGKPPKSGNPAKQAELNERAAHQRAAEHDAQRTQEARQRAARRRRTVAWWAGGSAVAVAIVGVLIASFALAPKAPPAANYDVGGTGAKIAGVETFDNGNRHVTERVDYPQTPAAGGNHFNAWLNCGVYTEPQENELAVHSQEHGAVWVTYDATRIDEAALATLQAKLPSTYIVLSPFPGQDTPLALSAWNAQLKLESVTDPRIPQFLEEYWRNQHVPEPTSACTGAIDGPGRR